VKGEWQLMKRRLLGGLIIGLFFWILSTNLVSAKVQEITVQVGQTKVVTPILSTSEEDSMYGAIYQWRSENPKIAQAIGVSIPGTVKGISCGTCYIYCVRLSPYRSYAFKIHVVKKGSKGKKASSSAASKKKKNKKASSSVASKKKKSKKADSPKKKKKITIRLSPKSIMLKKGKKKKLVCTLTPKGYAGKVMWRSSKPKVAKVNSHGVVTAKKNGKTTVTAKISSDNWAKCSVTVYMPIKKIKLKSNTIKLKEGEKKYIPYALSPKGAMGDITWSSSNACASVDSRGRVTGKRAGKAIITAKASSKIYAKCTVKVFGKVRSVKIDAEDPYVGVGNTLQLSAELTPKYTEDQVTWSSSDTTVASVSQSGRVKGKREGRVRICAKAGGYISSLDILVTKGLWLDLSKGPITFLESNSVRQYEDFARITQNYDSKTGVTIVQSDKSKGNDIAIWEASSAYCILAGVNVERAVPIQFMAQKNSHAVIEIMEGTENSLVGTQFPAITMEGRSRDGRSSLSIQGNGKLNLYAQGCSAIGYNDNWHYCDLIIKGGAITAHTDDPDSAVIGYPKSGYGAHGDISILTGAKVTASGGYKAVGAGKGTSEDVCGTIRVDEGTLTYCQEME